MDRVTCDSEEIRSRVTSISNEAEDAAKEAKEFFNVIEPIATKDGLSFLIKLKDFTESFVELTTQVVELVADAKVKVEKYIEEAEEFSENNDGFREV